MCKVQMVNRRKQMRKKSHILLARYIAKNTEDEELKKHRLSFYIGSILPDCKPSFVYKKHEINGTFPDVKKMVNQLIFGKQQGKLTRKPMETVLMPYHLQQGINFLQA